MKTTLLLCAISCMLIFSCKDEEEDPKPQPTGFNIIGSWRNDYRPSWVYTFKADSTFVRDSAGVKHGGQWYIQYTSGVASFSMGPFLSDKTMLMGNLNDTSYTGFRINVTMLGAKFTPASDSIFMNWKRTN